VTDKDITERSQKIGATVNEYKDSFLTHFNDLDVEVKLWNFALGNIDKELIGLIV
jgi:hypothetical protein